MFQPSKAKENVQIRIGSKVPPDAVNLAYYVNRTETDKKNSSVFVSSTEKKTMDSTTGEKWSLKKDLNEKNIAEFLSNLFYKDSEGYSGTIKRKNIRWEERNRDDKKNVTESRTYSLVSKSVPKTISYNDGAYSGTLYLKKAVYKDGSAKHTVRKPLPPEKRYFFSTLKKEGLSSPEWTFPEEMTFEKDGFKGKLKKIPGKVRYVSEPIPATLSFSEDIAGKVDGHFPSFLTKDGITLHPTGEQEDRTVEKIVKHYGVCRYWGGGNLTPNNYYGNANHRFSVGGGIARGYFTDSLPKQPTWRFGHLIKEVDKEERYPVETGGWYPPEKGVEWTFDIEEAMKYGGSSDPLLGGVVWASDYWTKSGGVWPPPGYQNDYLTANGMEGHIPSSKIHPGLPGSGSINHEAYPICTKAGPQRTNTLGFYSSVTGWRNKWFRNTIHFYKGRTVEKVAWAKYSGSKLTRNGYKFTVYQDYEGYLEKEQFEDITVIDSFTADCEYCGVVGKKTKQYDGRAQYEGTVYKKTSVADIRQEITPEDFYYVNAYGDLINGQTEERFVHSDIVSMTNVFLDGIPLHYIYPLKYPIYYPNGPKTQAIVESSNIRVVNSKMKRDKAQKYLIRLTPTSEMDVYEVSLIHSKPGSFKNPCYVIYDRFSTEEDFAKNTEIEKIPSQRLMESGIDYTVRFRNENRENNYKVKEKSIIADSRAKIKFSYVVASLDGRYRSAVYSAESINKKYATETERQNFVGRKMIVSPKQNGRYLSAAEIMKNAYPGTAEEIFGKLQYVVKVYETQGTISKKVDLYTEINGTGPIMAETTEETGFFEERSGRYIGTLPKYHLYSTKNGSIHMMYHVIQMDQKELGVEAPKETGVFERWLPRIAYTHFTSIDRQHGTRMKASYTMPEYDRTSFGQKGKPFVDVTKEKAVFIDKHHVKTMYSPLWIQRQPNGSIAGASVSKKIESQEIPLTIVGWYSEEGIVEIKEKIGENDELLISYIYIEECVTYKGYSSNLGFVDLNVNTHKYQSYKKIEQSSLATKQTYSLYNKTIYFFLKPTKVENLDTLEVFETNPITSLYHKIDDSSPEGSFDIMIGKIDIVPSSTFLNTDILDTRSLGGGLIEQISEKLRKELEPESDYYWNIGHWDGEPFSVNAVILIRLDRRLLESFTKEEIEEKINKHLAFGTLPIIEYVTENEKEEGEPFKTSVAARTEIVEE